MTAEEIKTESTVSPYRQGKLSFGKAREPACVSAWIFQQLLGSRMIPVHDDIEDYEKDLATLKDLKAR